LDFVDLTLNEKCEYCGSSNANIWGTVTNGRINIETRCMRCGSIHETIKKAIVNPATKLSVRAENNVQQTI